MQLEAALTTTRTVRKRLDLDRPVDGAVIEDCLRLAAQAPTASNRQPWHWVVVDDPALKADIAAVYGACFDRYAAQHPPVRDPDPGRARRSTAVRASSTYLRDNMHRVPVLVIPCIEGRVDGAGTSEQAVFWGSLLPAMWSFMLALRGRGLGSAWTTVHLGREDEVAQLLGIPSKEITQGGLLPVAHTIGDDFRPAPRIPVGERTYWNRWLHDT